MSRRAIEMDFDSATKDRAEPVWSASKMAGARPKAGHALGLGQLRVTSVIAPANVEVSATLPPHTRWEIGNPSAVCTTLSRQCRARLPSLGPAPRRQRSSGPDAMEQKDSVLEQRRSQRWAAAAVSQPTIRKPDRRLAVSPPVDRRGDKSLGQPIRPPLQ
jgi:hypothetical protein